MVNKILFSPPWHDDILWMLRYVPRKFNTANKWENEQKWMILNTIKKSLSNIKTQEEREDNQKDGETQNMYISSLVLAVLPDVITSEKPLIVLLYIL